ncbi:MAG: AsmA family protein [Sedimentisphaerales bacterium]|nr:AsmA family protein [Sedimentisphaerales bacterium]
MKKLIRSIVRLVVALVVAVILGAIVVKLFADQAVRVAVEKAGSRALDVPVEVEKARLSILSGTLDLRDLTVANPPGYQGKSLLTLDRGDIQVDAQSLLSDTITIEDLKLDGMRVFLEQKGLENNLREVLKSLRGDGQTSGKRLYVDNLEITNITVDVKLLPIPGRADAMAFELTPIKMTHLGHSQPLDIAALASTVLVAVATEISEQGGGVLPQEMLNDLTGVLNKALDIGRIIFGNGQDGASGSADLRQGITEGLKGLLKTGGDEEQ